MKQEFSLNDEVIMKKPHACKTNLWVVTRIGADVKIKCVNCGRIIMMSRTKFVKGLKNILEKKEKSI